MLIGAATIGDQTFISNDSTVVNNYTEEALLFNNCLSRRPRGNWSSFFGNNKAVGAYPGYVSLPVIVEAASSADPTSSSNYTTVVFAVKLADAEAGFLNDSKVADQADRSYSKC